MTVTADGTCEKQTVLPTNVHQDRRPSVSDASESQPVPMDGRLAAQLLIEKLTGWPDLTATLDDCAGWLTQSGGSYALEVAGAIQHSRRTTFLPNSPVAYQIVRQLLDGHGGLRHTDQNQRISYVCGKASGGMSADLVAISFDHDCFAIFRQQSVGRVSMKSVDVLDVVRGQNVLAAVEVLIWLIQRRTSFSPKGFLISPSEMLAAVGRRSKASRAELDADLEDIVSILRGVRLRQVRLLPNCWQFVSSRDEPAVRIFPHFHRVSVEPNELLPRVLHTILPGLNANPGTTTKCAPRRGGAT